MEVAYEIKSPLHRQFVRNVRARREELGLTKTDVANRLKVTLPSYSQIEHGRTTPTLELIEKVAKALKIEALELLSVQELATR